MGFRRDHRLVWLGFYGFPYKNRLFQYRNIRNTVIIVWKFLKGAWINVKWQGQPNIFPNKNILLSGNINPNVVWKGRLNVFQTKSTFSANINTDSIFFGLEAYKAVPLTLENKHKRPALYPSFSAFVHYSLNDLFIYFAWFKEICFKEIRL